MALTRIKTNQITDLAVTTAKLAANSVTSAKLENNLTYGSDFTVTGNLTVSGTTTSVSTTNTRVEDAIIALSAEATGSASVDSGLLINRGADDNQAMIWDESEDKFIFANVGAEDGDTAGNVSISSYAPVQMGALTATSITASGAVNIDDTTASSSTSSGALIVDGGVGVAGTVYAAAFNGPITGAVTGNADTATALATARAIALSGDVTGTANFDGTAGITIAATIAANSVALGTDTTGNYTATITGGNGIASTGATSGEGIAHSLSVDLADTNIFASDGTVSRAVVLDGSGDFTASTGTFTNIDGILGGNTPAAATVTSLTASAATNLNGAVNLGNASSDAIAIVGTATFTESADFDGGFTVAASQTIHAGANAITNVADPSSAQDAATKAYVDSEVSSGSTLAIAGDSGTDNVIVGTNTFTFSGTANEVTTAVTDNTLTIGLPSDVNISNDLTVAGNLTVSGTTTTLSTTNSVVSDSLIELNSGAGSNANDLGLIFERGSTGDNAVFAWDESVDKFVVGTTTATGASTGDLTIASGTLVAATFEGALSGNATTATALATARAIAIAGDVVGTANFDGSGDISITATIQADSVALGTDTTGNYVQSIADAGNGAITVVNGTAEGGAVTLDIAANAVALGTQTTGNYVATLADAGNSFFTIANSGSESAAVTIDLVAGSVTLGTHTSGNYVNAATGGNGITVTHTPAEGSSIGIAVDLTDTAIFASDGTASRAVVLDSSGDFTAGTGTFTNIDGILGANSAAAATVTTLSASGLAQLDGGMDVDGAFVVANTTGNISTTGTAIIGSATATTGVTFKVDSTDSMMVPVGTTGQRPGTGVTGMFRYNSTSGQMEYYGASSWSSISPDFTIATSQTFNGDDSTVAFTLSSIVGADSYTVAGVLVMLNGVVQEPTTVYGISGTTLTFTTAPATGDLIEVRKFTTSTTVVAIADIDGDTQIQVEETSDDDTIRFDVQGVEKAYLNSTGLVVGGNIHATGTITADGDIELGDASSDTVTFTAKVGSNIVPTADSTYDLGDNTQRWQNIYVDKLNNQFTIPTSDGTSGQALVTDGSGVLSFGPAGAVISSDTSTNTDFLLYFASTTSGALTAVKQDSGLIYNPSTGSLTATKFIGEASSVAANSVALGTDTTGNYVGAGAVSGTGLSGSLSAEGGTFTVTSNATSANTGGTIVARDGSGNFSAGVITGTSTAARYADLAEMYAADEAIEPGTVVMFGGEGKVAACDVANCRAVAGIISTDPAHLMNSAQEGVALALAGRVPCKVTGPVAAGDLMVSAGNGMAMANNEAAMGTVIGKAIEANEGGEGVIEVLALMM